MTGLNVDLFLRRLRRIDLHSSLYYKNSSVCAKFMCTISEDVQRKFISHFAHLKLIFLVTFAETALWDY